MYIFIKDMVCIRCKMIVETILSEMNLPFVEVQLGSAELTAPPSLEQAEELRRRLLAYRLQLVENHRQVLVERIKAIIRGLFGESMINNPLKFTVILSRLLDYDYTYLSNLFSDEEGMTIEHFYIATRIEKAKELIVYEKMSIKEVAYYLNYSSVSHFGLQFKKVTGETPATFRNRSEKPPYIWREV